MEKRILSLVLGLMLVGSASAECIEPTDGMIISADTEFCTRDYSLERGIIIAADITLDCNYASLEGKLENVGIYVKGNNVQIVNCNIEGYETGIYFENSNSSFIGGVLTENGVGIYSLNSEIEIVEVDYLNNDDNFVSFDEEVDIIKPEKFGGGEVEIEDGVTIVVTKFTNLVDERTVDSLDIRKGYQEGLGKADISREKNIKEDTVEYEIKVKAKEELIGVTLYEHIPEEIGSSADVESDMEFEIVSEQDIIFNLGNFKEGEEKVIVWRLSKEQFIRAGELVIIFNPFAILAVEKALNPTESWVIRLLFISIIVLLIINHLLEKTLPNK